MNERIITKEWIAAAIRGEEEALSFLYESAQDKVTQTVRAMVRDEDAVLDIVQDSFVKGFHNLSKLDKPENFTAWMRRIASNAAVDHLKKKRPVLFSELADEEGQVPEFRDEELSHLPEEQLDRQETSRLIRQIVEGLSDEQQMVIGMFYFEEMSIRDIAAALGCSENTVKSRLNYGRKNVEKKVRELEKQGIKLYSLAPIPFFLWLLRSLHNQPDQASLEAVLAQCADLAGAAGGAAKTERSASSGVKAGGKSLAVKIAAGVLAVAVVGGGAALAFFGGSQRQAASSGTEEAATEATESMTACEVNGHTWEAPTCETAKTCQVCGETEGEALGHAWIEANYQAPKTCESCGMTEGEPLAANYEVNGLNINVTEIGTEYDYVTCCYTDPTLKTVAKMHVVSYGIIPADETHEALEGYEWRVVVTKVHFCDENAWNYGASYKNLWSDYYEPSGKSDDPVDENGYSTFSVNWNGVEYTECLRSWSEEWSEWEDRGIWVTNTLVFRVPVGYDGLVIGYRDASVEWPDGVALHEIVDGNTLLFRLN